MVYDNGFAFLILGGKKMIRLIFCATSLVTFFVFAGSLGSVHAQRPNSLARKKMVRAPAPKPGTIQHNSNFATKNLLGPLMPPKLALANIQPQPVWRVSVDWGLQLDANTQALYQQMANLMSGVTAVPNDRLNYYSAVNQPPDWVIGGWVGMVTNVQTLAGGGYLVTVTASPVFPDFTQVSILSDYSEQYNVDQVNNVSYVGFLDPNNWAGTIPGLWVK